MKKLSLKNAKNLLSRKEMKEITGGYGHCGSRCGVNGCAGTCTICYYDFCN
jgi:hypothetical protein